MTSAYSEILTRIDDALEAARAVFSRFTVGAIEAEFKAGHDPVTEADRALDAVLCQNLLRDGEGWLSEESVDDCSRLGKQQVWVVDPLDGTREFVEGLPEFCVSIGFVQNGRPVAGGIYNPATREKFLGAIDSGVTYNGTPVRPSQRTTLDGALVLASRSEVKRGEWKAFNNRGFQIRPMGSVESAGGFVTTLENAPLRCNNKNPLLPGLIAGGTHLRHELLDLLDSYLRPGAARLTSKE